jgi:peptide deformylase
MRVRQMLSLHPHTVLKEPCKEVTEFDTPILHEKIKRMREVMDRFNGVGIAANQCFIEDSICIAKFEQSDRVLINPKIVDREGEVRSNEGCLSVPKCDDVIIRSRQVTVEYKTEDGTAVREVFTDEAAVIIQHEVDHLEGRLFIDYLSPLKQGMAKRKMLKMKKKWGLK